MNVTSGRSGSGAKPDPPAGARTRLPADPATVTAVRGWVSALCRRWRRAKLCDDAVLVAGELVSNAIRHAGTEVVVELAPVEQHGLLLVVSDGSTRPMRRCDPTLLEEGGRGLFLVDTLSTSWGVHTGPTGKQVWAKLQASA